MAKSASEAIRHAASFTRDLVVTQNATEPSGLNSFVRRAQTLKGT
jgi:hypothetical protein